MDVEANRIAALLVLSFIILPAIIASYRGLRFAAVTWVLGIFSIMAFLAMLGGGSSIPLCALLFVSYVMCAWPKKEWT